MMDRSYLDFEPDYHYREEEAHDVIEFQVKDFKKKQLKVQLGSNGVLAVSGERPPGGTRWIRFHKEFKAPKECKANDIHVRLRSGILYITIPKKLAPQISLQDPLTPMQQPSLPIQDEGKLNQESSQKKEVDETSTTTQPSSGAGDMMNTPTENDTLPMAGPKSFNSRLKIGRKKAVKVVASVAVLSLLFTVLFYIFKYYDPMIMDV
ncbi:inactive protein RESTRICTED TEV MOVEMENT 2-like [Durio zibethinus]|uniref:Inactive protein RESTRICTED TEV MOVEMENT 2-like n=1 Tax=Durio zibethinus TaxID=66656 RepID=A0A6P5Z4C0_DURZI|nr:inactive protein RESTRICTED TEV MOVEMENT 2-like [Durio zibethinus]